MFFVSRKTPGKKEMKKEKTNHILRTVFFVSFYSFFFFSCFGNTSLKTLSQLLFSFLTNQTDMGLTEPAATEGSFGAWLLPYWPFLQSPMAWEESFGVKTEA